MYKNVRNKTIFTWKTVLFWHLVTLLIFFYFFPVFLLIYFHKKETAFKATKPKTVSRSARFTSWESFKQL